VRRRNFAYPSFRHEDGLNVAGVRPMQIRVPLGTSTGWNIRAAGHRAPNLCGLTGSFLAFASTKADRLASGDPRKSLRERYKDHDGFVKAVEKAARELVAGTLSAAAGCRCLHRRCRGEHDPRVIARVAH